MANGALHMMHMQLERAGRPSLCERTAHCCDSFTSAEACGGRLLAVYAPVKLPRSVWAQRSRTSAAPLGFLRPACAKVQVTDAADDPRLRSRTATEPSASGRAQHSWPSGAAADTRSPCTPRGSWLTAMTSGAARIARVALSMLVRSVPISSGDAMIAHAAKWERCSSSDNPGLPICR